MDSRCFFSGKTTSQEPITNIKQIFNKKKSRFLSKHFCLQPFSPKDSLLFALFTISVRYTHGGYRSKKFWNLCLQIAGKCISLYITAKYDFFPWTSVQNTSVLPCLLIFFVCSGAYFSWSFMESSQQLTRKIHITFSFCKYLTKE